VAYFIVYQPATSLNDDDDEIKKANQAYDDANYYSTQRPVQPGTELRQGN